MQLYLSEAAKDERRAHGEEFPQGGFIKATAELLEDTPAVEFGAPHRGLFGCASAKKLFMPACGRKEHAFVLASHAWPCGSGAPRGRPIAPS